LSIRISKEAKIMEYIRRDSPAPDFTGEALYKGRPIEIRLSDFRHMWTVLFFYASDFTFV